MNSDQNIVHDQNVMIKNREVRLVDWLKRSNSRDAEMNEVLCADQEENARLHLLNSFVVL